MSNTTALQLVSSTQMAKNIDDDLTDFNIILGCLHFDNKR